MLCPRQHQLMVDSLTFQAVAKMLVRMYWPPFNILTVCKAKGLPITIGSGDAFNVLYEGALNNKKKAKYKCWSKKLVLFIQTWPTTQSPHICCCRGRTTAATGSEAIIVNFVLRMRTIFTEKDRISQKCQHTMIEIREFLLLEVRWHQGTRQIVAGIEMISPWTCKVVIWRLCILIFAYVYLCVRAWLIISVVEFGVYS